MRRSSLRARGEPPSPSCTTPSPIVDPGGVMGVCIARCSKCERPWRVEGLRQERGRRLRDRKSPCCHARLRRATRFERERTVRR